MSHSIRAKDKDSGDVFYCEKCGAQNEDLQSNLCKAAIHEEELQRDIEVQKIGTQRDIEVKKLGTQRLFYLLAIFVQIGIFVLLFKGFDSIAQAVNKIMGDIQTVLYECSRGSWVRPPINSFLNQN